MENTKVEKIRVKRPSKTQKEELNNEWVNGQECSKRMKQLMSTTSYMLFMSILTIYTIFAIDIDKGFFNKSASIIFSSIHVVSMLIFVLEIIVTSIIEKDYLFQFYFWIDIFSTLMMTLQLIWVEDLMNSTDNIQVAISFARVSKASRFSKIGARSTKIMKLIRLIKLIKLFKNQQEQVKLELKESINLKQLSQNTPDIDEKSKSQQNSENSFISQNKFLKRYLERPNVDQNEQELIEIRWYEINEKLKNKQQEKPKQETSKGTKVGETLKYEIQKNIVIMVMGLIMIVPLLSASTWYNKTGDMEPSTQSYIEAIKNESNSTLAITWMTSFLEVSLNSSRPVIRLKLNYFQFPTDENQLPNLSIIGRQFLRQSEKTVFQDLFFYVCYSKKAQTQITSWINIVRSILIIFLLLLTSIMFVKDLQIYALNPLEKMSTTVSKIEKNPFSVLQNDEEQNEQDSFAQTKQSEELELQTNILQNFFIKITSFLALGVGETPLKPISTTAQRAESNKNIFEQNNSVKVEGVFMCIQLANMQELHSYLEEKTSLYVNQILQIFHETTIENGGYVFHQDQQYSLVCWKFTGEFEKNTEKNFQGRIEQRKKAEHAFISYLKFVQKLSQSEFFKKYEQDYEHVQGFSEIGKFYIGLHCGVAYCGAIGSQFKLSLKAAGPDVNITKSLCRAAKKYKVENLISQNFIKIAPFSNFISRKIELIRYLQTKSLNKVEAYTSIANVNLRSLIKIETPLLPMTVSNQKNSDEKERKKIKLVFKGRDELLKTIVKNKNDDLAPMCKIFLKKYPNIEEYLELWKESCNYYEEGQWNNAKIGFQNSKQCNINLNDVISDLRLQQIGNKEEPPSKWQRQKYFSIFL